MTVVHGGGSKKHAPQVSRSKPTDAVACHVDLSFIVTSVASYASFVPGHVNSSTSTFVFT